MPKTMNTEYFKSINTRRLWYKDDTYILPTKGTKLFYLPDTKLGGDSLVEKTIYDNT
jgi:hypothetical protein